MKRLLLWVVDHPLLVGGLIALITLFLALELPKLEVEPSTSNFTVEKDPSRQYHDWFKKRFGSDTITIVVVKADDVFAPTVLRVIQRISDALEPIDEVTRVESLTTVRNIKGEGDSLAMEPLVAAAVPTDPSELARIRADALGNRVFVGSIVSKDAKAAAILAYTEASPSDKQFRTRFPVAVDAIIERESISGVTIYQTGGPFADAVTGEFVLRDLRTFVPISLGVLFLLLFLAFRMVQGVVIPLVTGVVSMIWSFGVMAFFGLPITILTAVIPSLLLVIGSAEDVHMLSEYHHLLREGHAKLVAIRTMLRQSALAILVTTATTVFGFGSLVTSDITMLIQFGYVSAMALAANFVVTVTLLPIMLRLWPVPSRLRASASALENAHGAIPRFMERLAHFNLRHRLAIAVVSAVVVIGSLVGWYSLRVDTDPISFFPEDSPIRQRLRDLESSLGGGSAGFSLVVETGREGGLKEPAVLRRIVDLQEFLRDTGAVDKTVSVVDYVRKMHREMNGGNPDFEAIPDTTEEVAQYLLTLEGRELASYVDFDASAAHIAVRHHLTGSWALSAVLERIEAYVAQHFPQGVTVRPTGQSILTRNAADYMALNELTSFGSTFAVIALVHAWLFRSLRVGLLSLIPNAIPVLFIFGLMGLLRIPLNPGTAMIASIALGIAVDDTVHHVVTYRRELWNHGDRTRAMIDTMKAQGRPVIYVSVALAGGFLVCALSNFVPIVHFGVLSGVVMLVAMVGELMLTPLVIHSITSAGASSRRRWSLVAWPQRSDPGKM